MNAVVIACGASKLRRPAEAHRLYTGPFFLQTRTWALSVTDLDHLFILSAKYGFVSSRTILQPYDVTLTSPGHVTSTRVAEQMRGYGLTAVTFVGGKAYADLLRRAGALVDTPFAGYGGMGYIMQALKRNRGRVPTSVTA